MQLLLAPAVTVVCVLVSFVCHGDKGEPEVLGPDRDLSGGDSSVLLRGGLARMSSSDS